MLKCFALSNASFPNIYDYDFIQHTLTFVLASLLKLKALMQFTFYPKGRLSITFIILASFTTKKVI